MVDDAVVTVAEAAKLLGVTPKTLRRWADDGLVAATRLPGRGDRRFSLVEVRRVRGELTKALKEEVYKGMTITWNHRPTDDGRAGRCWVNVYRDPESDQRAFAVRVLVSSRLTGRNPDEAAAYALEEGRRLAHTLIDAGYDDATLYDVTITSAGRTGPTLLSLDDSKYE